MADKLQRHAKNGPLVTNACAGRPKLGYGRLTLRLPEHTLAQLADLAHKRGVTRAQLVAELVEKAAAESTGGR